MKRVLGALFGIMMLMFVPAPAFAEPADEQDIAGYQIPPEGVWLPGGLVLPSFSGLPDPVCLVCDDEEEEEAHGERQEPALPSPQSDEAGE